MVVRVLGVVALLQVAGAVEASARDRDCPKGRKHTVEIEVVDEATGEPLADASVVISLGSTWDGAGLTGEDGRVRIDQLSDPKTFVACPVVQGTTYAVQIVRPGFTLLWTRLTVDRGKQRLPVPWRVGLLRKSPDTYADPEHLAALRGRRENSLDRDPLTLRGEGPRFGLQVEDFPGYLCAGTVMWLRIRPVDHPLDAFVAWPVQDDGTVHVFGKPEPPWSFALQVGGEYLVDLLIHGVPMRLREVQWESAEQVVRIPLDNTNWRYETGEFPCIKDMPMRRLPSPVLP